MSTKTYTLLTESRQWPTKVAGDTIDLPPSAAKYLVQAGVLTEKPEETAAPAKLSRKSAAGDGGNTNDGGKAAGTEG